MILLYTPTTSAEGAEVKQFYEDLQELSFKRLCSQLRFPSCSFLFAFGCAGPQLPPQARLAAVST